MRSRCLRDSRGSKLGKMVPDLGLRGSVKQCPGQSCEGCGREVEMAAQQGDGRVRGTIGRTGSTGVFLRGKEGQPQPITVAVKSCGGARQPCLARHPPEHQTDRSSKREHLPKDKDRRPLTALPCNPAPAAFLGAAASFRDGDYTRYWRDYSVRIDGHVRDTMLPPRLVILAT